MTKNPVISASILSADFANLKNEIEQCEKAGVDWIHIDVMDGHFVPNLTMGPFIVKTCHQITTLPLDCHLMVEKPENLIKAFVEAGASYITIHPENNPNVQQTLKSISDSGIKPGIALNPETSVDILQDLLSYVDMVLIMTVNPGFSGQAFMKSMVAKVAEAAHMIRKSNRFIRLEVDGGINSLTAKSVKKAGADTFVSASAIFKHPGGIREGVLELMSSLK